MTGGCPMTSCADTQNVRPLRRAIRSPLDRRWATSWYAELYARNGLLPAIVEDVSADGAKLRVGYAPVGGEQVTLVLANFSRVEARVAWRRRDRIGIQFTTSQPWIVELVRLATAAGDWFPITAG